MIIKIIQEKKASHCHCTLWSLVSWHSSFETCVISIHIDITQRYRPALFDLACMQLVILTYRTGNLLLQKNYSRRTMINLGFPIFFKKKMKVIFSLLNYIKLGRDLSFNNMDCLRTLSGFSAHQWTALEIQMDSCDLGRTRENPSPQCTSTAPEKFHLERDIAGKTAHEYSLHCKN